MALGPRDYIDPNMFYTEKLRFMENSILAFLQALFSTFPKTNAGDTNRFHFDPDTLSDSEILIQGANVDNEEDSDTRPKIVVTRGPVTFNQAGINAFVGSQNLSLASQRHTTIMSGTVGISCFSREELEADRLAEICATSIEAFSPIIRKFGYLEIRTSQIGQRALIGKDSRPELAVTPVLLKTAITHNWKREVVDPVKLRKMILELVTKP